MNQTKLIEIRAYLLNLQNRICHMLISEDGQAHFKEEEWFYEYGGGGISRIMTDGMHIEKAGVNFSHIHGLQLPQAAQAKLSSLAYDRFQAMGVSVVVHPLNPYIPTTHMNVRFVALEKDEQIIAWWFGGGFDLTPYYGFTEDCVHWHQTAREACEPFGSEVYPKYKKWCDDYFYLKHRQEPRGVGGLFFDDLKEWGFEKCFSFMQAVGDQFILAYRPIFAKRKQHTYGDRERAFQLYRRGRYVEFNLLYDRGTLFGLQSNGRTESILMSLPPLVEWRYNWQPEKGSPEAVLYDYFLTPKNWI